MTQIEQKTANAAAEENRMGVPMPTSPATLNSIPDVPAIVQRYADGESMQDLAREHGVNRTTIYRWMLSETGNAHADIVTTVLINRVAEADAKLEQAEDAVATSRAREQARFARMDLERRRPSLYGQKQQITHEVGRDLGELLREAKKRVAPRMIDVTPESE